MIRYEALKDGKNLAYFDHWEMAADYLRDAGLGHWANAAEFKLHEGVEIRAVKPKDPFEEKKDA